VTDRRDREQERLNREVDRRKWDEEDERRAETERRGEQLKEAWRKRRPLEEEPDEGRPKKGGPS